MGEEAVWLGERQQWARKMVGFLTHVSDGQFQIDEFRMRDLVDGPQAVLRVSERMLDRDAFEGEVVGFLAAMTGLGLPSWADRPENAQVFSSVTRADDAWQFEARFKLDACDDVRKMCEVSDAAR